jgi:hypothetical protein
MTKSGFELVHSESQNAGRQESLAFASRHFEKESPSGDATNPVGPHRHI